MRISLKFFNHIDDTLMEFVNIKTILSDARG